MFNFPSKSPRLFILYVDHQSKGVANQDIKLGTLLLQPVPSPSSPHPYPYPHPLGVANWDIKLNNLLLQPDPSPCPPHSHPPTPHPHPYPYPHPPGCRQSGHQARQPAAPASGWPTPTPADDVRLWVQQAGGHALRVLQSGDA